MGDRSRRLDRPERASRELLKLYPSAQREFELVRPQALGLQGIGHFGYFRRQLAEELWSAEVDWLLAGAAKG